MDEGVNQIPSRFLLGLPVAQHTTCFGQPKCSMGPWQTRLGAATQGREMTSRSWYHPCETQSGLVTTGHIALS